MRKSARFDTYDGAGWPDLKWLERYFLAPPEQQWLFDPHVWTDCAYLRVTGADGTDHLEEGKGRIDIDLHMMGRPGLGVLLLYTRYARRSEGFYSKGDMGRLREWVSNSYGDLVPVGFYLPFEMAWKGVKEFVETEGRLPTSIDWIRADEVPDDAWPGPQLNIY